MRGGLTSALGLAILLGAGPALAAAGAPGPGGMSEHMGGGLGGGLGSMSAMMPGPSAPRYDAASEYARAIAAMKARGFKAAALAAGHVTQTAPTNPDGWRLLGAAYAGGGDWSGSMRAYERAVRLKPADPSARVGLGMALATLKDTRAQSQLDWLKSRAAACGETCPDAARLKAFTAAVESAMAAPAAATAPPAGA